MDGKRPTTGSLVWHLAMRWRAAVDRAVGPLGITHAQYSVLASLSALGRRGERPSQRRLAEYTGLGPIYVSKLVRALQQEGLLARAPDPTDARAVQLSLTNQGADVIGRAMTVVRSLDAQLTASLGGPDSASVRELGAALQTLLHAAPEPDPTVDRGGTP